MAKRTGSEAFGEQDANDNNGGFAPGTTSGADPSKLDSIWTCNTTESMKLHLVRPQGNTFVEDTFTPVFTYPIFGENETVFGYKDLQIDIHYAPDSLHCYYNVKYSSKYQPSSSSSQVAHIEPDDVEGKLKEFLGQDCTTNYEKFISAVNQDSGMFKPIGEKVHEYSVEIEGSEEEHFEIYKSSFASEKFKEYHRRMQFFVLLFIEGSSYIDEDDEKWEIYTVFKRKVAIESTQYDFVGYCTAYPFHYWPENTRLRISQFFILPPYQGVGHGNELYSTLYQVCMSRSDLHEITVEDPNSEFSDLREKNDMRYLMEHNVFDGIQIPVARETIQKFQESFKLTKRQIQTYIEMYLLSKLDKKDKEMYKQYRLLVKERLLLRNFDVLKEITEADRKEKLDVTFQGVVEDYRRLLDSI